MAFNPFITIGEQEGRDDGIALRNKVAQQFLEYRRMNPEATEDDLRGFLSMAGGMSPYTGEQFTRQMGIEQIARSNAEAKAKRMVLEARQKAIENAQVAETLKSAYADAYARSGGDRKAAYEQTMSTFGNNAEVWSVFDKTIKPGLSGIEDETTRKARSGYLDDIRMYGLTGKSWDEAKTSLPTFLQNDPVLRNLHDAALKEYGQKTEDRDYTINQRKSERERENRSLAQDIIRGQMDYKTTLNYLGGDKKRMAEIAPYVAEQRRVMADSMRETQLSSAPAEVAKLGQAQVQALGLEDYAKSPEGKKNADLIAAAAGIAKTYNLNSLQLSQLSAYARDGKMRDKDPTKTMAKMMNGLGLDPKSARTLTSHYESTVDAQYQRFLPKTFSEAMDYEDKQTEQYINDLNAQSQAIQAAAKSDPGSASRSFDLLAKDIDGLIASLSENYAKVKSTALTEDDASDHSDTKKARLASQVARLVSLRDQLRQRSMELSPEPSTPTTKPVDPNEPPLMTGIRETGEGLAQAWTGFKKDVINPQRERYLADTKRTIFMLERKAMTDPSPAARAEYKAKAERLRRQLLQE